MTRTSLWNIKLELTNFLRNQDLLSTSVRGVTNTQETFSGDGSEKEFTLTQTNVKNIRSVTISSVTQSYGTDYTIDLDTATITFSTAPPAGSDNIEVDHDYGSNDRVFPDFPQSDTKLKDFPRIGFDILSGSTREEALGGTCSRTDYILSIVAYSKDQDQVETLIATIRDKLMAAKGSFYYSPFINPTSMGPLIISPFGKTKVFQRNQDFQIGFVYELE